MTTTESAPAFELSPEQKYEFDLQGYLILKQHYDEEAIAQFHAGIDVLQAIPIDYETYRKVGVASYFLALAMEDPDHPVWSGDHSEYRPLNPETGGVGRWPRLHLRDLLHRESRTRPRRRAPQRRLPRRPRHLLRYDHTNQRFVCKSTKSVVILSDMTHHAFPVTDDSVRRSVFFSYMPAIGRNNLPSQRMSIYPNHVLERLSDQADFLSSPGYI